MLFCKSRYFIRISKQISIILSMRVDFRTPKNKYFPPQYEVGKSMSKGIPHQILLSEFHSVTNKWNHTIEIEIVDLLCRQVK